MKRNFSIIVALALSMIVPVYAAEYHPRFTTTELSARAVWNILWIVNATTGFATARKLENIMQKADTAITQRDKLVDLLCLDSIFTKKVFGALQFFYGALGLMATYNDYGREKEARHAFEEQEKEQEKTMDIQEENSVNLAESKE